MSGETAVCLELCCYSESSVLVLTVVPKLKLVPNKHHLFSVINDSKLLLMLVKVLF